MANTLKIKRRTAGGGAGAPASLSAGELAYNEDSGALYIGTSGGVVQVNAAASLDATLTALAAADWAANSLPIGNGTDTVAQVTFGNNTFPARGSTGALVAKSVSDDALAFLAAANDAAMRTELGLGSLATQNASSVAITGGDLTSISSLYIGASTSQSTDFGVSHALGVFSTGGSAGLSLGRYSDDDIGPRLIFAKSRGTSIGAVARLADGDTVGVLGWRGAHDTLVNYPVAGINVEVDGTTTATTIPGRIRFYTRSKGGAYQEALRLSEDNTLRAYGTLLTQGDGIEIGNVGVTGSSLAGTNLRISKTISNSGALGIGAQIEAEVSAVSTAAYAYSTELGVATGASLSNLVHYFASQGAFNGTSTSQTGFRVASDLTGATTNYGFYSAQPAGAAHYSFYAANAQAYFGGNVEIAGTLTYSDTGSFTSTGSGFSGTAPTGTVYWTRVGKNVTLQFAAIIGGTSNSTSFTLSTLASGLRPNDAITHPCFVMNNGTWGPGYITIQTNGVVTVLNGYGGGSFTASGSKQVHIGTVSYRLA